MCQLDKPCSIISRDVQLLISFVRLPVVPRRNRTDEMRSRHFVMLTREYDLLEGMHFARGEAVIFEVIFFRCVSRFARITHWRFIFSVYRVMCTKYAYIVSRFDG